MELNSVARNSESFPSKKLRSIIFICKKKSWWWSLTEKNNCLYTCVLYIFLKHRGVGGSSENVDFPPFFVAFPAWKHLTSVPGIFKVGMRAYVNERGVYSRFPCLLGRPRMQISWSSGRADWESPRREVSVSNTSPPPSPPPPHTTF